MPVENLPIVIQEGCRLGVIYFNLTLLVIICYEGSRWGNSINHSAGIYVIDNRLRKRCGQEVFALRCNRDLVNVSDDHTWRSTNTSIALAGSSRSSSRPPTSLLTASFTAGGAPAIGCQLTVKTATSSIWFFAKWRSILIARSSQRLARDNLTWAWARSPSALDRKWARTTRKANTTI